MRFARAVWFLAPLAATALAGALVGWGSDVNTGDGPKLVEQFRGDLAAIVKAAPAQRPALIKTFVEAHGLDAIEVTKRCRNQELHELFVALLDAKDWRVQHRALFAIEHYRNAADIARAVVLLGHENVRVRERAALAVLKTWPDKGEPPGADDAKKAVAQRLRAESDAHVRSCLEALDARIAGKLYVERTYEEFCVAGADGLQITPFLDGFDHLAAVAPGYKPKGVSETGGPDASKFGGATTWTTPLLLWDEEEVQGTSLQPFANLRQNGTVYHTGKDVGACLDGAGYYAAADGVVKFVFSGGDMGTLTVIQHSPDGKSLVDAVYMHGGDTVFVKAGDRVRAGQLVGTMGMSYSIENGGHFAHLHYGMYPSAFSMTHNYGYKPVKDGLADWIDPAKFLPRWIARTKSAVGDLPALDASLAKAADAARAEDFAKALKEIDAALAKKDATDAARADADKLRKAIDAAPAAIVKRAETTRDMGYPEAAMASLAAATPRVAGLADAASVANALAAWQKDPAIKKALEGEKQIDATESAAAKLAGKKENAEKIAAMWKKLLDAYGDTCLKERIEEKAGTAK
jgi:murein DD-endopeptidase MepM/ murein hydrolase activator NlpD